MQCCPDCLGEANATLATLDLLRFIYIRAKSKGKLRCFWPITLFPICVFILQPRQEPQRFKKKSPAMSWGGLSKKSNVNILKEWSINQTSHMPMHQTIHPLIDGEVYTDSKSANRIDISQFVPDLLNLYCFQGNPLNMWGGGGGGF